MSNHPKRLAAWLLMIFSALLVLLPSTANAQETVQFTMLPASETVAVGETFTLTIQIEAGAQNVKGAEFHINYDAEILDVVDFEVVNDIFSLVIPDAGNAPGRLGLSATSPTSSASGTFDFAQIQFEAVSEGSADIEFVFDESNNRVTKATDADAAALPVDATAATVTVTAAVPTQVIAQLAADVVEPVPVGDTFDVEIVANNDNLINGVVNAELIFDTSVMSVDLAGFNSSLIWIGGNGVSIDESGGKVTFNSFPFTVFPTEFPNGNFVIGTVRFEATAAATDSPLTIANAVLTSNTVNVVDSTVDTTVDIGIPNTAPVANNDTYMVNEDEMLVIDQPELGVLSNDEDVDDDSLTAVKLTDPQNGAVTLNANGSLMYNPAPDFSGTDTFTYKANDGQADSNTATVTINVEAVNDAPVASDDNNISTNEDTPINIDVLSNDTDADTGDTLSVTNLTQPINGTAVIEANGTVAYLPNANFNGTDSFTYTANDGQADSGTATVSITVNAVADPVVAEDDAYEVDEDTTLNVLDPGVLTNDVNIDDLTIVVFTASLPANGQVTLNEDGSFTYTPSANFDGEDSFTYVVREQGSDSDLDSATVSITVNPVNDAPVAVADSYSVNEDTTLTVDAANGILKNDTDVENDTLTAVLVSDVTNGSLTLNADGNFTYTPNANFDRTDTFTYKANDGSADSNTVTVTITVNPVADPYTSVDDNYSVNEDDVLVVNEPGLLSNDDNPNGLSVITGLIVDAKNGLVSLDQDGSFTYTPNANFNGTDSFVYITRESGKGKEGNLDSATVTITVKAINDAPVANDDTRTTAEDTPITIDVVANDTDVENSTFGVGPVMPQPSNGTASINIDGTITYTPSADFNGQDTFGYQIADQEGLSDTATVSITVNPVNDAPVAVDDTASTLVNTPVAINVLDDDTDAEGDTLTIITTSNGPLFGQVSIGQDGVITYTPNLDFTGKDTFGYEISDGNGGQDIGMVTVDVDEPPTYTISGRLWADVDDNGAEDNGEPGVVGIGLTLLDSNLNTLATLTTGVNGAYQFSDLENGTYTVVIAQDIFTNGITLTEKSAPPTVNSDFDDTSSAIVTVNRADVADIDGGLVDSVNPVISCPANITAEATSANGATVIFDDATATDNFPAAGTTTVQRTDATDLNSGDTFPIGVTNISYTATDPFGNVDTCTFSITVNPVNTAPVAMADAYTTDQNVPLTVDVANGVLENDMDTENDTLTAIATGGAAGGGTLTLNADGSFTYTPPNSSFIGDVTFFYKANDGELDSSNAAITITVTPNAFPVAESDSYTTFVNQNLLVEDPGIFANDSDDTVSLGLVSQEDINAKGGFLILGASGPGGFLLEVPQDYTGTLTWQYVPQDERGAFGRGNIVTVTIEVLPTPEYTLTLNAENGAISTNPAGLVHDEGTVVQLTAIPDAGYQFTGWSGDASGTTNPINVTMDSDKTVTATFELIPTPEYTLTLNAENGAISTNPAGLVHDEDTVVQLTAIPDAGYQFTGWSGDASGTTNPINVTMDSDKTVTATFELIPTPEYTLTLNAENGAISTNPAGLVHDEDTVVQLTAIPNAGYQFTGWSGDASGTTNPINVTMDSDKTVTATFELIDTGNTSDVFLLSLIDAGEDTEIAEFTPLVDGAVLNLAALPEELTISVDIEYNGDFDDVDFTLDDPNKSAVHKRSEGIAPYALAGDSGGDFTPYPFAPGEFTLTLVLESDDNEALDTYTMSFTVVDEPVDPQNQAPVAIIASDNDSGTITVVDADDDGVQTVMLDARASSDDVAIVSYQWTVGGNALPDNTPVVASAFPVGETLVSLTVTDAEGLTSNAQVRVVVEAAPDENENQAPTAVISAEPGTTVTDLDDNRIEAVTLNGEGSTDPDGDALSYEWKIGDTLIGNTAEVNYNFPVGATVVTLMVSDGELADSAQVTIVVNPAPDNNDDAVIDVFLVNAEDLSQRLPLQNGIVLDLNALPPQLSIEAVENYDGSFDDVYFEMTGAGATVDRSEGRPPYSLVGDSGSQFVPYDFVVGNYMLSVYLTDGSGNEIADTRETIAFTVIDGDGTPQNLPPQAIISGGPSITATDNDDSRFEQVMLNGSTSTDDAGIVSYVWTIGNTVIGNGAQISYDFPVNEQGVLVTLTVQDAEGLIDTDSILVIVNPAPQDNGGGDDAVITAFIVNAQAPDQRFELQDGAVLDLSTLPPQLSIEAEESFDSSFNDVFFSMTGAGAAVSRSEGVAPYALIGDTNGGDTFNAYDFVPGAYTLTLYLTNNSDQPIDGTTVTINFTVVEANVNVQGANAPQMDVTEVEQPPVMEVVPVEPEVGSVQPQVEEEVVEPQVEEVVEPQIEIVEPQVEEVVVPVPSDETE